MASAARRIWARCGSPPDGAGAGTGRVASTRRAGSTAGRSCASSTVGGAGTGASSTRASPSGDSVTREGAGVGIIGTTGSSPIGAQIADTGSWRGAMGATGRTAVGGGATRVWGSGTGGVVRSAVLAASTAATDTDDGRTGRGWG